MPSIWKAGLAFSYYGSFSRLGKRLFTGNRDVIGVQNDHADLKNDAPKGWTPLIALFFERFNGPPKPTHPGTPKHPCVLPHP
jgi:hypothetical protein